MSDVKVKHTGGDSKAHPTSGNSHKMQKPGMAGNGNAKMQFAPRKK